MNDLQKLGNLIAERLGGRSQSWLSRQSGVDQSTISRLIRGKNIPTPETLEAIGRVLGLEPVYLMKLAGIPLPRYGEQLDPSAAYIARRLTELPKDIRDDAIDALSTQLDVIYRLAKRLDDKEKEESA